MEKKEYKYQELTGNIIACSMRVHSALGNGFPEKIYHRALAIELKQNNINFKSEVNMDVYYKGEKIGQRRVDFLIEDKICVEIKAVIALDNTHLAQAKNYLEAFNLEVGLLINFGNTSLEFKRVENHKNK